MNESILKHKRRFKKYTIFSLVFSVIFTYLSISFAVGWIKGDGGNVLFNSETIFVIIIVFVSTFASLMLPGYLLHVILTHKDR